MPSSAEAPAETKTLAHTMQSADAARADERQNFIESPTLEGGNNAAFRSCSFEQAPLTAAVVYVPETVPPVAVSSGDAGAGRSGVHISRPPSSCGGSSVAGWVVTAGTAGIAGSAGAALASRKVATRSSSS
jgi:hypothetical protein